MSRAYSAGGKRRSSQTHARRSRVCEFCGQTVYGNGGQVAHARAHVRLGEAVELVKAMPYPFPPSRLFLAADDDAASILAWTERGYTVRMPR